MSQVLDLKTQIGLEPSRLALQIENLTVQFGGLKAVSELSFTVPQGRIYGLIGPNGAGKTTVFNLLTGVYQPTTGDIRAFSQSLNGLKPHQITARGLARTFQNIRLFKNLTVMENILIAMDRDPARPQYGLFPSLFRLRQVVANDLSKERDALELLSVFGIDKRASELARNLPYGDARRLEIARALATGARILLLDEPAAGMNPQEKIELMGVINQLRDMFKITLLIIEHDMRLVMGVCERIIVLDHGEKIAEGTAEEIRKDEQVIEAYLGKSEVANVG